MSSGAAAPAEPDGLLVARLHAVLRDAGAELSPRELSDVLWLALHTPGKREAGAVTQADTLPTAGTDAAAPAPLEPQPEPAAPTAPGDARRSVHALAATGAGGGPGAPIRLPGIRGLRHPLNVVRALRSLKRRVPSAHRYELDESATAESIADSGVVDAVLRPAKDRWLHLVLAVDDGPSMRVWRDTVAELTDALSGSGIFRSVRVSPLDASSLLTGGPTVVLTVTDAVADHWYTGTAQRSLAALARRAPTAVIHLFPTGLWSRTGVAAEPMLVRTTAPAPSNSLLRTRDPWLPPGLSPPPVLPVPVMELDEASLRPWADLIASQGGVAALRVTDAAAPVEAASLDGTEQPGWGSVADRVRRFRANVSPHAYQLAAHLAAVDPLTLPVMRLVQAAALPETSSACLAEVLLSGLMRVDDPLAGQDVFAFAPETRDVLRAVINSGSAQRTVDLVSDYIAPRLGRTPEFPAVIAERTGTLTLPRDGHPLAELAPVDGSGADHGRGDAEPSPWEWRTHNLPRRRTTRWLPALAEVVEEIVGSLVLGQDPPVVVRGPAGSDKTTIALEYAHRTRNTYTVAWWVDARNAATLRTGLGHFMAAVAPTSQAPQETSVEQARRWLGSHTRWLLVLDHVTDDHEVTAFLEQVATAPGHVLATTRLDVASATATILDLTGAYRARSDSLTGLRHSRTLYRQLAHLLCSDPDATDDPDHRHVRLPPEDPEAGQQGLAVLLCTLDGWHSVHDRFGAAVSDAVLVEAARRLVAGVRDDDTVARLGTDSFAILVGGLDPVAARDVAERLRSDILTPIKVDGRGFRVGARFEIRWGQCGTDPDEIIPSERQDDVRPRASELQGHLTDALCELESLDDEPGRLLFAELLGETLGQPITLRGALQREDVATLVRAALAAQNGRQALIDVVTVFEGASAGVTFAGRLALADDPSVPPRQRDSTEPDRGRLALLGRLTDALSTMECMEDPPGRAQFADLLGDLLERPIDVRGASPREDVVVALRTAMQVHGWARTLLDVVRILEGPAAADDLAWLTAAAPMPEVSGVLPAADETGARALLRAADDELSATDLHEALSAELTVVRPPTGLRSEQLLSWALNFNAQPDALPPAVLLMECAARLVRSQAHRTALTAWVDAWTESAGLTEALRRRRAATRRKM
ncbi:SAV_2336 N-terminal domain-related protein [Streptomyces sp. NBC_01235]|uniref:SAV_2336 N-terminal domain-related protein n=1 Tax=Streptomyces sp. NBC_01235 TaxID=2903788 RepID=UPI002E11E13E|nr:SAV_2336 family protein [Streptomyces sp. NBC_01235]